MNVVKNTCFIEGNLATLACSYDVLPSIVLVEFWDDFHNRCPVIGKVRIPTVSKKKSDEEMINQKILLHAAISTFID